MWLRILRQRNRQQLILPVIAVCVVFFTAHALTSSLISPPVSSNSGQETIYERVRGGNNAKSGDSYKTILLWTPRFGDRTWDDLISLNQGNVLVDDNGRRCLLSTNRSLVSEADALFFHGRDLDASDMPGRGRRRPFQRWVFFSMEPPPLTFTDEQSLETLSRNGVVFNWTASYSSKADVYFPYARLLPETPNTTDQAKELSDKIFGFIKNFSSRRKDAVWIVSNCNTMSLRENLVDKLKELGVKIDIFGGCSGVYPPDWDPNDRFFADYRYYLSFENSMCDDYVSEKLFRGLKLSVNFGVIPVGYHSAVVDYARLGVPRSSFINVADYLPNNVTGLADYLKNKLPRDLLRLTDHFTWQFRHKFGLKTYLYSWQQFCGKLWQDDARSNNDNSKKPQRTLTISNVRASFGECLPAPFATL